MTPLRSLPVLLCLAVLIALAGYGWSVTSYKRNLWPIPTLRAAFGAGETVLPQVGTEDAVGRLVSFPGKVAVPCPAQTADTAVLFVIGQSNAANHAGTRITTRHPQRVLNVFEGKCYAAASPLLGATGEGGEFLTLVGDKLVDDGAYKTVMILESAVTDSPISRWRRDGDLNEAALATLKTLPAGYKVTHVIWHQGENDLRYKTSTKVYRESFLSLLATLRETGVAAPVFLAVATTCGDSRGPGNPVAEAQRALVDDKTIFLGADTDALVGDADRRDRCHFTEAGQRKTALSYAAAIEKARRPQ